MQLQKLKSKVSTFRDLPLTIDFDGLDLCFSFARRCCLCAEFYSLNVTSIIELVGLGSEALLQLSVVSMKQSPFFMTSCYKFPLVTPKIFDYCHLYTQE